MSEEVRTKELAEHAPLLSFAAERHAGVEVDSGAVVERASGAEAGHVDSFDSALLLAARLEAPAARGWSIPQRDTLVSGKYRVGEALGAGGMGAVLRATHVVSGRQVALKWLLPSAGQASVRFVREAHAAGRIDHPNVVDVYDLGVHEGGLYLVMELLRGRTLGERIREQTLTPHELIEIMVPTLRGVSAAHAQHVIHRDLKPDNVFLCEAPDGSPREPKVLDFGVSKIRADLEPGQTLTRPGAALGTLPYMSPEQLDDAPEVDERTDIYAAGVMMYEALSGKRPFCAGSDGALVRAILAHRPPALRSLAPSVPPQLERVIMRAMAKRPADRQPDVATLIRELEACACAAACSTGLVFLPRAGRRKLGAVLALAAAGCVLGALFQLGNPDALPEKAHRRRPVQIQVATPQLPEPAAPSCLPGLTGEGVCEASGAEQAPHQEDTPPSARAAHPARTSLVSTTRGGPERTTPSHVKARAGLIHIWEL